MCDYSLHNVTSRPARVGDKLVTTEFLGTPTRGFSAVGEPNVAVCLLPGTEIAFDAEVQRQPSLFQWVLRRRNGCTLPHRVGIFRQVGMDDPNTHHDAIEFPDGQIVLLTRLRAGQHGTVLQLPVNPVVDSEPVSPANIAL